MESKIFFLSPRNSHAPLEYCFQSQNPDELREGAEGWWSGRRESAPTPPIAKGVKVQVHMLRLLGGGSPGGTAPCPAQGRVAVGKETE